MRHTRLSEAALGYGPASREFVAAAEPASAAPGAVEEAQPASAPNVGSSPEFTGPGDTIGDDTSSTTTIAVGGSISSAINTGGDLDYVRVTLVAGQTYTFTMSGGTLDDDYIELRTTANVLVAEDDDGGIVRDSFLMFRPTTSGDYFIVARAWSPSATGTYDLAVHAIPTGNSSPTVFADNGLPQFSWEEAAIQISRTGASWSTAFNTPAVVTYAYRSTAPGTMPDGTSGFSRFNAAQITAAEACLAAWASVANIVFQRVNDGDGYSNNATMLFANYSSGQAGAAAFAYRPQDGVRDASHAEGDVWVNVSQSANANPTIGAHGFYTMLHEIGHAIGLSHPGDYNAAENNNPTYQNDADYFQDSRMFTTMSYFEGTNTGGALALYPSLPQIHDIAAAQRLYGVNTNTRTGDTIYGFNSNTGLTQYTLTVSNQPSVFTVWDGGGNDTIDFSGYASNSTIDLRAEAFSSAGPISNRSISIARGVVIENAIGGGGNDTIIGNDAANVLTGNAADDIINGNGGADTLNGGTGADQLFGGDGDDVVFWDAADSLANVLGGAGSDLLVFTSGSAPTTFGLGAHEFEAAEGRFTDAGGNAWSTRTERYDSLWRLDYVRVVNDDNSHSEIDYDQANAFNFVSNFNQYDALNRLDVNVTVYDSGFTAAYDYDQAGAFNWVSNWNQYAPGDLLDINVTVYDDGFTASNDYDQAGAFDWTTNWVQYDALGRLNLNVTVFDSGVTSAYDYDEAGAFSWTSNWNRYAPGGALDMNVTVYDNGATDVLDYDQASEFDWATDWKKLDALGRLDQNVLYFDDGRYAVIDYDQANEFSWANMWWLYDQNGNLLSFVGTNDDGSGF